MRAETKPNVKDFYVRLGYKRGDERPFRESYYKERDLKAAIKHFFNLQDGNTKSKALHAGILYEISESECIIVLPAIVNLKESGPYVMDYIGHYVYINGNNFSKTKYSDIIFSPTGTHDLTIFDPRMHFLLWLYHEAELHGDKTFFQKCKILLTRFKQVYFRKKYKIQELDDIM